MLEMMHYTGIGSKVYQKEPYSLEMAKLIVAVGFCPSAGGARAPIASILSYVDHDVGDGTVR